MDKIQSDLHWRGTRLPGKIKNVALRTANTKVSINSKEDPQQEIFKHTPESERLNSGLNSLNFKFQSFSSKIYSRHTVFLRCPVQNSQNNKVSEDIVMLHKPFRSRTVLFWYPFWGIMLVKIPRSTKSIDGHKKHRVSL